MRDLARTNNDNTDLEYPVGVVILFKTPAWVPEDPGVRIVPQDLLALSLHRAPGEGVERPAGTIVNRGDTRHYTSHGGLPGQDTHEVDTEIHRDNVGHTVSLDEGRPQYSLPSPGQHPGGGIEVVHPA